MDCVVAGVGRRSVSLTGLADSLAMFQTDVCERDACAASSLALLERRLS